MRFVPSKMPNELAILRPRPGVSRQRVLLIGFQDQTNLGLRYLMSAACAAGHAVDIATYQSDPAPLLERSKRRAQISSASRLIFQYRLLTSLA